MSDEDTPETNREGEPQELSAEFRVPIEKFLDDVERALLESGVSRSERNATVAELETQILTLVERRRHEGIEIDASIVQGIVDGMDPPSAYRTTQASSEAATAAETKSFASTLDRPQRTPSVGWDPLAWGSLACWILGLAAMTIRAPEGFMLSVLLFLTATALGVFSIRRIRRSDGYLHGLMPATIATFGGPLVAIWTFLIFSRLWILLAVAAVLYAHYVVAKELWRRMSSTYNPRPFPVSPTSIWNRFVDAFKVRSFVQEPNGS